MAFVHYTCRMIIPATRDGIRQAALRLNAGGIVAMPTETVYGLAGRVDRASAIDMIYSAKGRAADNPLIVHAASAPQALALIRSNPISESLAREFWPGPLTIIGVPVGHISRRVTGGGPTLAVRVPNNDVALQLLASCGAPVAAPSANRSGRPSPTTARHVEQDLGTSVMVLDGGACSVGIESTVIWVNDASITILRPGTITVADFERIGVPIDSTNTHGVTSPGTRYKHYAPNLPVRLCTTPEQVHAVLRKGVNHMVLAPEAYRSEFPRGQFRVLNEHDLYANLRQAEDLCVEGIVVLCDSTIQQHSGLMDRLRRAADATEQWDT